MKTKIVAIPVVVALAVFVISYTTMEKSGVEKPDTAEAEKKAPRVVKAKVKKKPKAKAVAVKSSDKPLPADANEGEITTPAGSGNSTIINVLTNKVENYAAQNNMSTEYCFLVDMSLPSGRNRFFVYDLKKNSVIHSGLVAHGSCNETFLSRPRFSNEAKTGCSSLGKYQVGEFYKGKYGKSFRLHGLDNCNSNAYKRAVVIHGYDCVPDKEIFPRVLCNSMGCVMVSYKFFDKLARIINKTGKPIVLWVYQ